ncbi:hypothetical protein FRX31_023929, partial [Thalictrum thalictroides]
MSNGKGQGCGCRQTRRLMKIKLVLSFFWGMLYNCFLSVGGRLVREGPPVMWTWVTEDATL